MSRFTSEAMPHPKYPWASTDHTNEIELLTKEANDNPMSRQEIDCNAAVVILDLHDQKEIYLHHAAHKPMKEFVEACMKSMGIAMTVLDNR